MLAFLRRFMQKGPPLKQLDCQQARMLLNQPKAVVIDVRERADLVSGYLPGAINIPLSEIEARINELLPYRDCPVLVNCKLGGRSATACQFLQQRGFSQVHNLLGGVVAWQAAGLPLTH